MLVIHKLSFKEVDSVTEGDQAYISGLYLHRTDKTYNIHLSYSTKFILTVRGVINISNYGNE